MAVRTWACGCGRRVPLSVEACRCGAPRPNDATSLASDSWVPPAAEQESRGIPKWVTQLGGVLLLVGLYFGSRGWNRWQTSREARAASVEALSKLVGAENAEKLVDEHHEACFDETYRTGWGRRQSSKFDVEKYVRCIVRGVERVGRQATHVSSTSTRAPVALPPTPIPPRPPPTPQATPEPDYGMITLGDLEVTAFKREPNVSLVLKYVAIGKPEALQQAKTCMVEVQCGGQPIPGFREPTLTDCRLAVDGPLGKGSLAEAWGNTTPVQGACTLRFAVMRAARFRSNVLVVPLEERAGR